MLKKSVLVAVMLLVAMNVWALGPADVSNTIHNLSSGYSGYYASSNEDEVCIFCHTPHGGTMNTPLWNHQMPGNSGFTHYTSATLSPYMKDTLSVNRVVNPQSLLCMSCHDGTTSVNSIINYSNRTGAPPTEIGPVVYMWFSAGAAIGAPEELPGIPMGKNLSDDHPISFSYTQAFNDTANTGKLQPVTNGSTGAKDKGIRFFGDPSTENFVECSSCHDPHVDYETNSAYTPFLTMPNTGSALCFACHIK